ncbi:urophorphyrin III synthase [Micromonas commoda]|uniref:Uroporphyrinogen-III synthase n=1 Tax=Micromonas commoda (strain RCC299 / NOUM17 / CCMP2709) TaxID=296587 RepID=C1EAM2_MICCC|nr:urophorphyrin III synthase [Micromonas commoda]ACO64884.1 urophorphyrin III synthase [Micromonas commoda]|eukprot:XP_002503626.1 urophorphyrin III synthase [Micromonas commoda]
MSSASLHAAVCAGVRPHVASKRFCVTSVGHGASSPVSWSSIGLFSSSGRFLRGPLSMKAAPATAAASKETEQYAGRCVVLTREEGKNGDMCSRLTARGIDCLEMPLIETINGADRDALPAALNDPEGWTWVCITSPEAAKVFLEGWTEAGRPDLPIATVGAGTARILAEHYASGALAAPTFTPSKANADTMVVELPVDESSRVLYPASAKAASTLQDGLAARGATVTRLDTYSTENVTAVDPAVLARALAADVVTFGSPSAVKAWMALSGLDPAASDHPAYACIGGTSAKACDKIGLPGVLFPEDPGVDGWEGVVLKALEAAR